MKIAVLTSGGDAPGMNAAIRAVVRTAIYKGAEVYGIERGYNGLIRGEFKKLEVRDVSDIIQTGGTKLYTARCAEFREDEGVTLAAEHCKKFGIEGIVTIGGDGTFRGALDLSRKGINCIGIPGTIDNDIACSEYSIGFDTAMNTAMRMVDNIRDTAQSHDRCSIVEVMGRNAGFLALNTGVACGATSIIIPEDKEFDIDDVVAKILETKEQGKKHFIIIVAEGVGGVEEKAKYIEAKTGIESRATVLGHVQRGGSPTVRDRVVATQMGYHAVELLLAGATCRVVVMKDEKITDYDIEEALKKGSPLHKPFDEKTYEIANAVSI
ncbi:MAG: 6-phosphofructokinase [Oscillospiraceae bacterium]|nr:6-phosphofructokinase [Oscillospiraceae bacterium]